MNEIIFFFVKRRRTVNEQTLCCDDSTMLPFIIILTFCCTIPTKNLHQLSSTPARRSEESSSRQLSVYMPSHSHHRPIHLVCLIRTVCCWLLLLLNIFTHAFAFSVRRIGRAIVGTFIFQFFVCLAISFASIECYFAFFYSLLLSTFACRLH